MGFNHLVAIAGGGVEDRNTLATAVHLALRHSASLEVLPAHPDAAMDMIALGVTLGAHLSADVLNQLAVADDGAQGVIEALTHAEAQAQGLGPSAAPGGPGFRVLRPGLRPAIDLAAWLDLADIVVFSQAYLDLGDRLRAVLGQALILCRAPVLVSRGPMGRPLEIAAVAWDGSLQAGRAVRAALPLLAEASRVVIVQQPTGLDRSQGDADAGRLRSYLEARGVSVQDRHIVPPGDEGRELLAAARSHDADLFVAGAYGHSRLREIVFGGATQTFLHDADGPSLLLAH